MPYTAKTVPDYVPASKAAKWAKIWNTAYDYAKGDGKSDADAEKYAFAVASSKALGEGNQLCPEAERFYEIARKNGTPHKSALEVAEVMVRINPAIDGYSFKLWRASKLIEYDADHKNEIDFV